MGSVNKSTVLPFSPPIDRWTDDHYTLFSLFEYALGNRKEQTPEEIEEMKAAQQVEELIESGDPNWLAKVQEIMDGDLGNLELSDELFGEINSEQLRRGE